MLYQIHNGTVSLDGDVILDHIDFEIKGREKAALVGRNGAGKTTLMRLLAGELEPDADDKRREPAVYRARNFSVGMLRQNPVEDTEQTLAQWIHACLKKCAGPTAGNMTEAAANLREAEPHMYDAEEVYAYKAEFHRMMTGLGFTITDEEKKLGEFSGGERTKLMLIHLLLAKPELLLLDEPTNHLDLETTEWLEQELKAYPGAIVLISHDRFFIDRIVDVVWEVQDKKIRRFAGNYTAYRAARIKDYEKMLRRYEEQQAELKRLNDLIERFKHKPNKAAFARSRKKMIERMELIEKPVRDDAYIFTGKMEPHNPGSKWVLETDHLQIGYDKTLLELNLRIRRGQKIGIIGANGAGKSTFLKTIMGEIPARKGKCSIGNHVEIGYYDQLVGERFADMEEGTTVYEHFSNRFPGLLQQDARKILGQYLFSGRITATPVTELSGGEKARLALCEILTEKPNFLVLDEPTNHMDIPAKETLESAFRAYTGTILFVSHDRYFIDRVADALLVFEEGNVYFYPFGYAHYLDRKRRFGSEEGNASEMAALVQAENAALVADMRAVPKREHHETRQMTSDEAHKDWQLRLAGDPMEEAKARVEELNEKLTHAATYEEYEALQAELDAATEEWTRLCGDWYDVWES